ncbi:uncharacterized protein F5147DRAFT_661929 [Suillus discolor]|uniref:Uncharacterized protein n=1 Tax=Suillus discolor TaxID=1912936 RepID=A0A9P7EQW2_9AGAM|nr:uncharacterized protein F5147DRAFT_730531 [Suillus discolor]XP_041284645.1 uncharacterized protein F5147DRAFT_730616 [Suillus discolor]XP_041299775.1 uncharacterized protein F5147DRAFT_661929 [Suillus discolor]KAG2085285.1 hypothetical protein F5147DRAFT_730531 [Suillus discolor]KAG2085295.1 hypothetical protein F5147DRAFT_730616 [Suillus discolor]KAG2120399.1 hypothetical protein F5147DRAFT_661929 [Suillus discolor]
MVLCLFSLEFLVSLGTLLLFTSPVGNYVLVVLSPKFHEVLPCSWWGPLSVGYILVICVPTRQVRTSRPPRIKK